MQLKISIITAVYNGQKTLPTTIDSVLSQRYPHIEYIIVDGHSTDGTVGVIQRYSDKIDHWLSEPDTGIYDAMNKGLQLATGDIIGILNADDFYHDAEVISRVVDTFTEHNPDAVYGDLVYVDSENPDKIVRYWQAKPYRENKFKWGWMPPHPTFFVRKALYQQYGLFNTQFRCSADYEFMLRLIHRHKINLAYLPEILVHMRTGGISNQSWKSRVLANREDYLAWQCNELKPAFYTLWFKPLRKLVQYFNKPKYLTPPALPSVSSAKLVAK